MSNSLQSLLDQLKQAQRINLSDMYIGDEGARMLSNYLKNNKNLKCLEIRGNNISAQGFIDIVGALRFTPLIKVLSVEWNQLGSDPAALETLGAFLVSNKSLQHIGLSNNKLNGDQIEPFANSLRSNTTLLSLDLRWNDLSKKGGQLLKDALIDNKSILYLDLNGTDIGQQDQAAIDDILDQHRASNPIQKNRILQIDEDVVEEGPKMNTGLQGSSIVQHLEQMLEQERVHTLHIKQRMERELDELVRRDRNDTRLLEELDVKSRQLEADNRAAQFQVEKLRDEYTIMERQQEDMVRSMEDKIRQNEFILTELEKKHRSNLDRALNENNFRTRDLVRDWENRCRLVEDRSRQLENENRLLEEELRQLQERQIQLKITYDQELRDLGRRVEEEEYQKFHSISNTLDAKIRAMEEARDLIIKRNADAAKEYDIRIGEAKQELNVLYEELERLKNQNKDFVRQNTEYRNKCDQLKQAAKLKEQAVEKYEKEINTLNEQIELKRKMQSDQLKSLLDEQKADRNIWENALNTRKEYKRLKDNYAIAILKMLVYDKNTKDSQSCCNSMYRKHSIRHSQIMHIFELLMITDSYNSMADSLDDSLQPSQLRSIEAEFDTNKLISNYKKSYRLTYSSDEKEPETQRYLTFGSFASEFKAIQSLIENYDYAPAYQKLQEIKKSKDQFSKSEFEYFGYLEANIDYQLGRYAELFNNIEEHLNGENPFLDDLLSILIDAYLKTKQFEEALQYQIQLNNRNPGKTEYIVDIGRIYQQLGQKEEAYISFLHAYNDGVEHLLEQLCDLSWEFDKQKFVALAQRYILKNDNIDILFKLAKELNSIEYQEKATRMLEKQKIRSIDTFTAVINLGEMLFIKKEYQRALREFELADQIIIQIEGIKCKQHLFTLLRQSQIHYNLKNLNRSLELIEKVYSIAVSLDNLQLSYTHRILLNILHIRLQLNMDHQAYLNQLLLNADAVLLNEAGTQLQMKFVDDAIQCYEKALESAQEHQQVIIQLNLASSYSQKKDYQRSIDLYRYLESQLDLQGQVNIAQTISRVYKACGKLRESLFYLKKALKLAKSNHLDHAGIQNEINQF